MCLIFCYFIIYNYECESKNSDVCVRFCFMFLNDKKPKKIKKKKELNVLICIEFSSYFKK